MVAATMFPRDHRHSLKLRLATQTGATINNIARPAMQTDSASASISAAIGNVQHRLPQLSGQRRWCRLQRRPAPDQPGGGVWGRAVGGQVNISSSSSSAIFQQGSAVQHSVDRLLAGRKVAGVQVKLDITVELGRGVHNTTAGYLGAKTNDNAGFVPSSAVLRFLRGRNQRPFLCRHHGPPRVLQHQSEQPRFRVRQPADLRPWIFGICLDQV